MEKRCLQAFIIAVAVLLSIAISGCTEDEKSVTASSEHRGEHERDRGDNAEGEESGTELALNETYDNVRNGARLILAYDAQSNSFNGTVQNTTEQTLERVRVEVHLSNGKELGPTTPGDLKAGEKRNIKLAATSTGFDGWSAHPEVGNEEHVGEERGEHSGREGGSEHGSREGQGEHGSREGSGEHR